MRIQEQSIEKKKVVEKVLFLKEENYKLTKVTEIRILKDTARKFKYTASTVKNLQSTLQCKANR